MYKLIAPTLGFALLVLSLLGPVSARAGTTQLLIFESPICYWCERWHEEIGHIYPKTAEGACAPLRSLDVYDPHPEDLAAVPRAVFTPTFVLVENGQEVGRILGYPGEDFFWPVLQDHLGKLSKKCDL